MKKFLSIILALMLLVASLPVMAETEVGSESITIKPDGHYYPTNAAGEFDKTAKGSAEIAPATCTTAAVWKFNCLNCNGVHQVSVGDPLPHTEDAKATKTYFDKTCTEYGYWLVSKCSTCGQEYKLYDITAEAPQHIWANEGAAVKATCTTEGYQLQKCTKCGETQKINVVKPLEHKFSTTSKELYKAPTCLEYGYKGVAPYCTNEGCTAIDEKATTLIRLEKLTHTESDGADFTQMKNFFFTYTDRDDDGQADDLTAGITSIAGWEYGKKVEDEIWEAGKDHGWAYGDLTYNYVPATCAGEGYVSVKCECGVELKETIAPLKHEAIWQQVVKYENDLHDVYFVEVLPGNDSIFVEAVKYVDKFGKVAVSHLGELQQGNEFGPAFYHDLFDCTEEMIAQYVCVLCEQKWDGESFNFVEHTYEIPVSYHQISPIGQEINVFVGEFVRDFRELPADAIVCDADEVFNYIARCTDYTVVKQCLNCQQFKAFPETGKGHNHKKSWMVKGAEFRKSTCTMPGADWYTCSYCHMSFIIDRTATADHEWEITNRELATCEKDGTIYYDCKNCDATKTEVNPAMGHVEYEKVVNIASCEKEGLTEIWCKRCETKIDEIKTPRAHYVTDWNNIKVQENCQYIDLGKAVTDKDGKWLGSLFTWEWLDCTKAGKIQFICAHCNLQTIEYTPEAEHELLPSAYAADKACDCKEPKTYTYTDENTHSYHDHKAYYCKNCKALNKPNYKWVHETEEVPHNIDQTQTKVTKAATCTSTGTYYEYCVDCKTWIERTIKVIPHHYETTWDAEKKAWTYTCSICKDVISASLNAPKFVLELDGIKLSNKTSGKGYVSLEENTVPIYTLPMVYLRWTWVTKDGCDVVTNVVRPILQDEDGNYYFDAKGFSVSGATLSELVVIITDDLDAEDKDATALNILGYDVLPH